MPYETRVNLLHLLEDIRDAYALPVEEVIVTELAANALDSGASRIEFITQPERQSFSCIDDGRGMARRELKEYHDIAATTKERGRGIGFAGIGAKLSLLVASNVRTETRGPRGSRSATEWRLVSPVRAPWHFVPSPGDSAGAHGTVVTIEVMGQTSILLDPFFIRKTLSAHFSPFLHPFLVQRALLPLYRREIRFFVNGDPVLRSREGDEHSFDVFLTRASRRPVGVGYVVKRGASSAPDIKGLAVSAYGKVIKRGWEWIGVFPKSYHELYGAVEIPGLAALLTTNKTDFLHDGSSLKKYYRYRKAIQEAVRGVLRDLGEERPAQPQEFSERFIPLKRSIESTLEKLISDFPELSSVVGERRIQARAVAASLKPRRSSSAGIPGSTENSAQGNNPTLMVKTLESGQERTSNPPQGLRAETLRAPAPGLKIAFEALTAGESASALSRLNEDTVWINTSHPAWQKAEQDGFSDYHVVTAVAWSLSQFLQEGRLPHDFVGKFLAAWGENTAHHRTLFKT